jgi:hypothetical protein
LEFRLKIQINWISQDQQASIGRSNIDPQPVPLAIAGVVEAGER